MKAASHPSRALTWPLKIGIESRPHMSCSNVDFSHTFFFEFSTFYFPSIHYLSILFPKGFFPLNEWDLLLLRLAFALHNFFAFLFDTLFNLVLQCINEPCIAEVDKSSFPLPRNSCTVLFASEISTSSQFIPFDNFSAVDFVLKNKSL